MSGYQVNYTSLSGDEKVGVQPVTERVSINDAFDVAAGEAADAFKGNGGDSYKATDLGYEVAPTESNEHEKNQ